MEIKKKRVKNGGEPNFSIAILRVIKITQI